MRPQAHQLQARQERLQAQVQRLPQPRKRPSLRLRRSRLLVQNRRLQVALSAPLLQALRLAPPVLCRQQRQVRQPVAAQASRRPQRRAAPAAVAEKRLRLEAICTSTRWFTRRTAATGTGATYASGTSRTRAACHGRAPPVTLTAASRASTWRPHTLPAVLPVALGRHVDRLRARHAQRMRAQLVPGALAQAHQQHLRAARAQHGQVAGPAEVVQVALPALVAAADQRVLPQARAPAQAQCLLRLQLVAHLHLLVLLRVAPAVQLRVGGLPLPVPVASSCARRATR